MRLGNLIHCHEPHIMTVMCILWARIPKTHNQPYTRTIIHGWGMHTCMYPSTTHSMLLRSLCRMKQPHLVLLPATTCLWVTPSTQARTHPPALMILWEISWPLMCSQHADKTINSSYSLVGTLPPFAAIPTAPRVNTRQCTMQILHIQPISNHSPSLLEHLRKEKNTLCYKRHPLIAKTNPCSCTPSHMIVDGSINIHPTLIWIRYELAFSDTWYA